MGLQRTMHCREIHHACGEHFFLASLNCNKRPSRLFAAERVLVTNCGERLGTSHAHDPQILGDEGCAQ